MEETDELMDFLRHRGVSDDLIQTMWKEKIDSDALLSMEDQAMQKYIPAYGDRLAVVTFLRKTGGETSSAVQKSSALDRFRSTFSRKRGSKVTSKNYECVPKVPHSGSGKVSEYKRIELGWKHYNTEIRNYKQVRSQKGGGCRQLRVSANWGKKELIKEGTNLFFHKGQSCKGFAHDMSFTVQDFREVDMEETSVEDVYKSTCVKILRLYMCTKRIEVDISDDGDNDHEIQMGQSSEPNTSKQLNDTLPGSQTSSDHSDNLQCSSAKVKISVTGNNSAKGNSNASGHSSTTSDSNVKGNSSATGNRGVARNTIATGSSSVTSGHISATGNSSVTGNNSAKDDRSVTGNSSVTGNNSAKDDRSATGNSSVTGNNSAKDDRSGTGNSSVTGNNSAKDDDSIAGNSSTSGVNTTSHPLDVMIDSDQDGPSEVSNEINQSVLDSALAEETAFDGRPISKEIELNRVRIQSEMIAIFKTPEIVDTPIYIRFNTEKGADADGVSREAYSSFWKEFCEKSADGEDTRIPALNPDYGQEEWQAIGRILLKGFLDIRYFPLQLAPVFIEALIFGEELLKPDDLFSSFMLYLCESDREVVRTALEDESMCVEDQEAFEDLLDREGCHSIPEKGQVKLVIQQLAHKCLIQNSNYALEAMRSAVGDSLKTLFPSIDSVRNLYSELQPTVKKVCALLQGDPQTKQQNQALRFLNQYVRSQDTKSLGSLLQFLTGSSVMSVSGITIEFTNSSGFGRRPIAHTCGPVLELPDTYTSYRDFRNEWDPMLASGYVKMEIA